jgi:hypothetical protein
MNEPHLKRGLDANVSLSSGAARFIKKNSAFSILFMSNLSVWICILSVLVSFILILNGKLRASVQTA